MRSAALAVLVLASTAVAAAQSVANEFERRERTSNGITMKYGLFVPEDYDPDTAYPLVLALHGNGERAAEGGGDNLRNIAAHDLATVWATPEAQAERPAFVLAPQVPNPPQYRWSAEVDPDVSDFVATQLTALEILEAVEAEFNIDPDRIYVVGLSMGGHGTWDLISRLPGRFAAAVPMSGEGFTSQADDVAHVPVWAFTGETDGVVPPGETRRVIQAMEDLGRDAVYTHCQRSPVGAREYDCPGYIGRDSLEAAVEAHADLIYWSEPGVGHGPWRPWFNNEFLAPWLFSFVRQDPDAVTVTSPAAGDRWAGTETVTWASTRTTQDTVEVWVNRTGEASDWRMLGEVPIADGSFDVDAGALGDAARARVRLIVTNEDGRVAGRDESAPFAIDNPGDAPPELSLDGEPLAFDPRVGGPSLDLGFLAADADGDALSAEVAYSADGGATYAVVATPDVEADGQTVTLDLRGLPNSREARLRVTVSDGTTTVSEETVPFLKQTPRDVNTTVARVAGSGEGSVELHFVDESALTGHTYRITIQEDEAKTYSVTDLDTGDVVLEGVPLSDGVRESPVFDGIALVVEDLAEGRADLDATGWVAGDTDLGVTVSGGQVRISILTVDLLATEVDYTLTVTDGVAGPSTAIYNIAARDARFTVTDDDGTPHDFAYVDDGDGALSAGDVVYLLEPDADGDLALAWKLEFAGGTVAPEPSDAFRLVPVRSLGAEDAFEFEARFNTAVEAPPAVAGLEAFPNPFGDRLTVAVRLEAPAAARVEVFDALGRRVAVLHDGPMAPAARLGWDARGAASGAYVVRLTVEGEGGASTVRRSVVRVGR